MKSKLGLITMISTLFLYWKHVELAKIRRFRCETLRLFFSKQAQDSYYHGISAATVWVWTFYFIVKCPYGSVTPFYILVNSSCVHIVSLFPFITAFPKSRSTVLQYTLKC